VPYPPIEPYESGMPDTGDGNFVYWQTCGNPRGVLGRSHERCGAPPEWACGPAAPSGADGGAQQDRHGHIVSCCISPAGVHDNMIGGG